MWIRILYKMQHIDNRTRIYRRFRRTPDDTVKVIIFQETKQNNFSN